MNDRDAMHVPLRPAAGARLFIVGDEGVLFSPERQELYGTNPLATLIWCCLEEGMDPARIAATVAGNPAVGPGEAVAFVRDAIAGWRAAGLIEGGNPAPPPGPPPSRWLDPAEAATYPPPPVAWSRRRRYRLLESTIEARFADEAEDSWAHPVLAHLEVAGDGIADATIAVVAEGTRHLVYCDGEPAGRCDGLDALAPVVKHTVWRLAIGRARYFLDIHAGVVGDGTRCLLLPAAPGSGKSTLTAALVHAGWRFLSDEVALLDADGFRVRPMPMAFCVKSTGFEIARRFFPDLDRLPVHRRADGKLVRYVPPDPATLAADPDGRFRVAAVVFPRYAAGVEPRLAPVGPVAALGRIMKECLILRAPLDEDNVGRLVRWIASIPCHELVGGSLDRSVRLIEDAWSRV
jgi:hypothetical protein